jgi:hypothetical protein
LHSEAGFKKKISGRSQSKEAVFLFDEYTYKWCIGGVIKIDDLQMK